MNKNLATYSIPYVDQPLDFWEKIREKFQEHVKNVFFPIHPDIIGTGRPIQPSKHLTEFLESGLLPTSLLVNPIILPNKYEKLQKQILGNIENYISCYHIIGITVTNLDLAKDIRKNFPELELGASTLMEIRNQQQLVMIEDIFDVIVPSTQVIRSLQKLEALRSGFNGKIRILVNESCLPSCVYRTQHFFEMSSSSISYPSSLCNSLLEEKPWLRLTGSWILPQHLYLLDGLFDEIKLSGRISLSNPDRYIHVLSAYLNRETIYPNEIGGGPAAVYLPLPITAEFYKTTLECEKNCTDCNICNGYWNKNAIDHE